MSRKTAIGIDLGTTYSCVAAWFDEHNRVEVIPNEQGNKITPSCVAWNGTELLIGEAAKNQISMNPKNTVFDIKRLMGGRFNDSLLQKDVSSWPFKVIEGSGEKPIIQFEHESGEKKFSPEEISSLILKNLKKSAEAYLGKTVSDAVITVPAYFNVRQRQATMDAARLAGLNVRRLIGEPISAAIAYGLHKSLKKKNIFIFDMGGGTLDVSLLIIEPGKITVRAVGGNTHLGGEDFDKAMVNYCVQVFNKRENKDLSCNARAMVKLKVACEKAKRDLSSASVTRIEIDSLHEGVDFSIQFSRAKFEELNAHFFNKCINEYVDNCLRDGSMHKNDVDDVVIVGGSTRIPKLQELLMEFFNGKPLCRSINADEAVAYGAAVLAAKLSGNIIKVNKNLKDLTLLDVTPLSIGIRRELRVDDMSVVVPKNTPIPTIKELVYTTSHDNQVSCAIQIYQGESNKTAENIFLDSFIIDGIPAAPAFHQQLKVSFHIDGNGILSVSAMVISTGNKKTIRIASRGCFLMNLVKKKGG